MENTINVGTHVNVNNEIPKKKNNEAQIFQKKSATSGADTVDLSTKLEKAKKQNGLIEKVADKIKGALNHGHSYKTAEAAVEKAKNGEITEEEANAEIKKYRQAQENTAQAVGDIASSAGSIFAFFKIKQLLEKITAKNFRVNNDTKTITEALKHTIGGVSPYKFKDSAPEICKNEGLIKFISKHADKRSGAIMVGVLGAITVGAVAKSLILKLNRIGTKQYKAEIDKEKMSKEEIKTAKKEARKAKRNANLRNMVTGAINGLLTPVISLLGIAGAPIYVVGNSLSRYFIGTREDKGQKSFKGYVENLKTSPITHATAAVAIALPAIKEGRYNKTFEKNIDKAIDNLKNSNLKQVTTGKTSYEQLEEIMFNDETVNSIMQNCNLTTSEKIKNLTDENIFAVKFKQINSNSDELARALKTECPATRTLDEAQDLITKTFGNKYKVQDCVGVGTVAETYLVKEGDKEYCIKMLKEGITAEKITKDKEKFIQKIQNLEGKSNKEKEFLIKNIENIADGVLGEVNLENEMSAAKELAKVTKKAKMVKPIEVKNNIYVMEKANGISLSDFSDYTNLKYSLKDWKTGKLKDKQVLLDEVKMAKDKLKDEIDEFEKYKESLKNNNFLSSEQKEHRLKNQQESIDFYKKEVDRAEDKVKKYEKFMKLDKLGIGKLSEQETQKMLNAYQDILVEQFYKVDKGGKVIHGDIHPGNIFIDIPALKAGKNDFFTLIDTGNTIKQTQEQAMRSLNLSKYVKNADYENIANFVLEGAALPKNLDKNKAKEIMSEELKKAFFDNNTHIGEVSSDNILSITDGVMQNLNIIPADTQGNLIKCKTSAKQSMNEFINSYFEAIDRNIDKIEGDKMQTAARFNGIKNFGINCAKYPAKSKLQEQMNLSLLAPQDRIKLKRSNSAPKTNSLEYLTYTLKQGKKLSEEAQEINPKAIL